MPNVIEAIVSQLPEELRSTFNFGVLGLPMLCSIAPGSPIYRSDIELLLIPGFIASGYSASIDLLTTLELTTHESSMCLIHFREVAELAIDALPANSEDELPPVDPEVILIDCAHIPEQNIYSLTIRKSDGAMPLRKQTITEALLRYVAYFEWYPNRIQPLNDADSDERLWIHIVNFLKECSGAKSPSQTRLSRAIHAAQLGNAENFATFAYHLKDCMLIRLEVSTAVRAALLQPISERLHDTQVRELIYLARSASSNLKALAASRLLGEADRRDVRATLEQLAFDANAWVRGIAGKINLKL